MSDLPPTVRGVSLIAMPWATAVAPSAQIGTVHSLLARRGIACRSHSFQLAFAEHVVGSDVGDGIALTLQDYEDISNSSASRSIGDWIFAVPPFRSSAPRRDDEYLAWLADTDGTASEQLAKYRRLRELVPSFLDGCLDEVLGTDPAIVGFTTTFNQTVASLVLAAMLKARRPDLKIVFGGAGCEGPMGVAMARGFEVIDVVVRGEAEHVVGPLMEAMLVDEAVPRLPGLCYRDGNDVVVIDFADGAEVDIQDVPIPTYDEYFERLERSPLDEDAAQHIILPYESSRGCWWGAKSHCTFCGLNAERLVHRSKPADQVFDEMLELVRKYRYLDVVMVDNIIDMGYFRDLLPRLASAGLDLRIFYETKSNLTKEQVMLLASSGVTTIQPGIETLSTPVLRMIRKGVTALQNIQLLKWCASAGVIVDWNVIHGFPGERPEHYERMAALLPLLVHLAPPRLTQLRLDRFSPYARDPDGHGIALLGPQHSWKFVHDVDAAIQRELCYSFEFRYLDGTDPKVSGSMLHEPVAHWREHHLENLQALTYRRGPGHLLIDDRRTTVDDARYTLEYLESIAYLSCDAARTVEYVCARIRDQGLGGVPDKKVAAILSDMVDAKLMIEEEGRYLALAIPRFSTRRGAAAALEQERAAANAQLLLE